MNFESLDNEPRPRPATRLAGIAIALAVVLVVVLASTHGLRFAAAAASIAPVAPIVPQTPTVGVAAQLEYVLAHWSERNVSEYGSLDNDDCVNFASQSLIARGWPQTAEWWHTRSLGVDRYSPAWISSTALSLYLARHPELAEPLTDGERSRVAVGDLVQFDWDNSGNRDHTGIVTRIVHRGSRIEVDYASHSHDREYMSVDAAIALDGRGGTVYFWHLLR